MAAHQAATFQRVSGGRLLLNIVAGHDSAEQRRFGNHLSHDQRYEQMAEFLTVLRGVSGTGAASGRAPGARPAGIRPAERGRAP
ncbi:MAG: LLM class flavin-dependent oxidoreductase [Trebonia sp.]